jgi:hypothetical protein
MKFPEPTVNIKEIARKYHHAELEDEKKIEKLKLKQLTTEAKRDKVSKKDGKTAPKGEGAKKSERATRHGKEAQLSEVPETKEPEGGRQFTLNSRERRANHESKSRRSLAPAAISERPSA